MISISRDSCYHHPPGVIVGAAAGPAAAGGRDGSPAVVLHDRVPASAQVAARRGHDGPVGRVGQAGAGGCPAEGGAELHPAAAALPAAAAPPTEPGHKLPRPPHPAVNTAASSATGV